MEKQLQYRDVFVLYVLAGLGVCRMLDLQILAGFNNASYARRRVSILMQQGFVASEFWGREKIYYLTYKGYLRTERIHPTYKANNHTTHDLNVARFCSYLYLTEGVSYLDFLTDRQMFYKTKGSSIHRPDVVLGNDCFEYERSVKNYKILRKNIKTNAKYDRQVWIVNDENRRLRKMIMQIASEEFLTNVELISYEQIDAYVKSVDLSENVFRSKQKLEKRNYEILLQDNSRNEELEMYLNKRGSQIYD